MGYWEDLYKQAVSLTKPAASEIGKDVNLGGAYDYLKNLITNKNGAAATDTLNLAKDTYMAGPTAVANVNPFSGQVNGPMQMAADQIATAPSKPTISTPSATPVKEDLPLPSDEDRQALLKHIAAKDSKANSTVSKPEVKPEGPTLPTDQDRRNMLEKNIEGNKGWEIGFQALGGIGDALAAGINAAFKTSIPAGHLKAIMEMQKSNKDEARNMLEKAISNDPNSQTSKTTQDAYIKRLKITDPTQIAKIKNIPDAILFKQLPIAKEDREDNLKEETLKIETALKKKELELKEKELGMKPFQESRTELVKMTPEYKVARQNADDLLSKDALDNKLFTSDRVENQQKLEGLYNYYNKYVEGGRVNPASQAKIEHLVKAINSPWNTTTQNEIKNTVKEWSTAIDRHYNEQSKLAGVDKGNSSGQTKTVDGKEFVKKDGKWYTK